MYSGFHVCSPYCGFCKPAKKHAVICEQCGWTDMSGLTVGPCPRCGKTLPIIPDPEPLQCAYVGELCMNPCGKGKLADSTTVPSPIGCSYHTPQSV